jgi:thiamine biosynthesis lipoprotein
MRCAELFTIGGALVSLAAAPAGPLTAVHQQRYSMGTMFDIVAYHASRPDAERAVARAMAEIDRLDRVMSHYRENSDLARVVRDARSGSVAVEPSLFEVIQTSLDVSRRGRGAFDVTVGPLVKLWRAAHAQGRTPSPLEISRAKHCVGYEKIEEMPPDRIRFRSDCLDLDLGGIGKGYAVDRAMAILGAAGIRDALVNAGSSSIAAAGHPPGREGWPVTLGAARGAPTFFLSGGSVSTSQQSPSGETIDPRTGLPVDNAMTVNVLAPSATISDALSTSLLVMSLDDGRELLPHFAGVSAVWVGPDGELKGSYGAGLNAR